MNIKYARKPYSLEYGFPYAPPEGRDVYFDTSRRMVSKASGTILLETLKSG